jgi:hypothetical protein
VDRAQHIEAAHVGHDDVGEDDVVAHPGETLDRRMAVRHRFHLVAGLLEPFGQEEAQALLVVDDKDPNRCGAFHALGLTNPVPKAATP